MAKSIPVLIPYVGLGMEKQRLAWVLGPRERSALALDMLAGVVGAVRASPKAAPFIVSPDPSLAAHARRFGAHFLQQEGLGLNSALTDASAILRAGGCRRLAVVHGDLPLVAASDVEALLDALTHDGIAIAPNKVGTGTNAVATWLWHRLPFVFGESSRARFEAEAKRLGLSVAIVEQRGLRLDVDGPEDLSIVREGSSRQVATQPP